MERVRSLVEELVSLGVQIDKGAFEALKELRDKPEFESVKVRLIAEAKRQAHGRIVTRDLLEQVLKEFSPQPHAAPIAESVGAKPPVAKGIEARIEIVRDPSSEIGPTTSIEEFALYFRDRFERLARMLRQRPDSRDARSIADALRAPPNERVKFIAMIMEKRGRRGRLLLEVDDLHDTAFVLVDRARSMEAYQLAQRLPLDQVVCIEAIKGRGEILIGENFILPDLPERKPRGADEHVYAVLLSDLHVGSRMFLDEALNRVVLWLNGSIGNGNRSEIARRVKYVIIGGDIVDGIGVYPRQEEELAISDIYEQYRVAAEFIGRIPDYMEVIVIPGNHDAVRQALPQPPIPRDMAETLYEARELISLGNPAEVKLHGVRFLLHHGRSLDDIMATSPGMGFKNPVKAMELQLKCRHLAPEYGKRTSIAPWREDRLIIEEPPDVFQSGHIHVVQHENYRGTQVVNSGAWQARTQYQRRMGIEPTPGILPVVNLQNLQISLINFYSE